MIMTWKAEKCHCKGVLVRNYHAEYSNYRAQNDLDSLLKRAWSFRNL